MRNRLVGVLFLAGVFMSATAEASPITINFTGVVALSFPGGMAVPTPLTGWYTYESTTPDTNANAFDGTYAAVTAYSMSAGSWSATGSTGTISVADGGFFGDLYQVSLPVTTFLGALPPLGPFEWLLRDNSQTAIGSDDLPTSLDLAAFGSVNLFRLPYSTVCGDGCGYPGLFGYISSVTVSTAPAAVPEPGTLLLIGTGLAFVVARRRRR